MGRAESSGSTRGEAQARAGDLAPGARHVSPAEAVPSGAALVGRPGGLPRGLNLTAFRDALSVDGGGLLAATRLDRERGRDERVLVEVGVGDEPAQDDTTVRLRRGGASAPLTGAPVARAGRSCAARSNSDSTTGLCAG